MLNSRFREQTLKPNPPFVGAGSFYGSSYACTKDAYQLFANTSDSGNGPVRCMYCYRKTGGIVIRAYWFGIWNCRKNRHRLYTTASSMRGEKEESYKYGMSM